MRFEFLVVFANSMYIFNFQTKENLISLLVKNNITILFMESFDDNIEYPVLNIKVS